MAQIDDRQVTLIQACPSPESFQALWLACGHPFIDEATAIKVMAGSVRCASLYEGKRLIGFGRIVGDYALHYYVQDVMVAKDKRGSGLSADIQDSLMAWLADNADPVARITIVPAQKASESLAAA